MDRGIHEGTFLRSTVTQAPRGQGSAGGIKTGPGWKTHSAMLGLYTMVVAIATYPMVLSIRVALPATADPIQALSVMRWYKTCLIEGRSPFLHAEIQHPMGAPIGSFSPMLLQTAAYLGLSTVLSNDILCYNILWFAGFLLTGIGTYWLALRIVGDLACAGFAGVVVMLSSPMMLHAHGHLELMYVGWFPLFMIAWMRLLEHPGRRSLLVASGCYGLMVLSSGYFAVLTTIPAACYVAHELVGALRRRDRSWLRTRAAWLVGFSILTIPFVLVAFSGQFWNLAHGLAMNRSRAEFDLYHVPWYGYVVPTLLHPIDGLFDVEAYDRLGYPGMECASYLGVVTLGLILYAAWYRVGPRGSTFWWPVTAVLVVLSFGAYAQVGPIRVGLPAAWLYDHVFVFRALRAPSRFNLFAAVGASVLAASGLKHLIARWPRRPARWAITVGLTMVAVADLSMVPFPPQSIPSEPACYARLAGLDRSSSFLDVPLHRSNDCHLLPAIGGYWQSFHKGRTTGGYSGIGNGPFDNRLVCNTPFSALAMADAGYLQQAESSSFGILSGVRFLDYAWLYLTANDLRYVVLHHSKELAAESPLAQSRLADLLGPAQVFHDDATTVFDRDLLPTPRRPVLAWGAGWRGGVHGRAILIASKLAEFAAYNPPGDRSITFTIAARSFREPRTVRLVANGDELARWSVRPDLAQTYRSPSFRLPEGLQTLSIESDGEEPPQHRYEAEIAGDRQPISLIVTEVSLQVADDPKSLALEPSPRPAGTADRPQGTN